MTKNNFDRQEAIEFFLNSNVSLFLNPSYRFSPLYAGLHSETYVLAGTTPHHFSLELGELPKRFTQERDAVASKLVDDHYEGVKCIRAEIIARPPIVYDSPTQTFILDVDKRSPLVEKSLHLTPELDPDRVRRYAFVPAATEQWSTSLGLSRIEANEFHDWYVSRI